MDVGFNVNPTTRNPFTSNNNNNNSNNNNNNSNNNNNNSNNNEGQEQPETLEQKRDNVIEKLNNIVDLGIYIQKKKIDLNELNDKDFDILIYAIEHSSSVPLIKFILNETTYDSLNYSFFDTGKYKSFFVSVIDHHIDYKGFKVPLFSAIASNKFRIADLLLRSQADINYRINGDNGKYQNVDIINYLYYMSSFSDFLNKKNLKYILHNGFNIRSISADLINKMVNRNYSDGLLEILLKHCIYDNHFIIHLLTLNHHRVTMSKEQLQHLITEEKSKIAVDERVYDNADQHENYDAICMILDYDGRDQEDIYEVIEDYELLERAIEYDHVELVKKILSYDTLDLDRLNIENALSEASKNTNVEMLKLLLDRMERTPNFSTNHNDIINFETILKETSRYHNIHYRDERKLQHIEIMSMLLKKVLGISWDSQEDPLPMDEVVSAIKDFSPSYLSLIVNVAIKIGHLKLVKGLLEHDDLKTRIDINAKDGNGECPLTAAYHRNAMEIFQYLLDYGANTNLVVKTDGTSLLSLAIQNKNYMAIKMLLKQNISLEEGLPEESLHPMLQRIRKNQPLDATTLQDFLTEYENQRDQNRMKVPGYGFTPLIYSYLLKRQEIFKGLVSQVDLNELDSNGYSVLHYAILSEDIPTVTLLLSLGAELHYKEEQRKRGNTALDIAISIKNSELFTILLNCPRIDLNIPDWRGETSLITAIKLNASYNGGGKEEEEEEEEEKEKMDLLEKLLARGADVNYIDSSSHTPLMYAIQEKSVAMVRRLIEQGAEVNYVGNYDTTPLMVAIEKGFLPVVQLLVENGAQIDYYIESKNQSLILYAVTIGNLDIIKYLVDGSGSSGSGSSGGSGVAVNFNHLNDFSEWMEAINANGKMEIFDYLAEEHPEVWTSHTVSEIISWNRLDLMERLVKQPHFDINLRDEQGNTPLAYAIRFNERAMVNLLIEAGADIFSVNQAGQSMEALCDECYDRNNNDSISIQTKIKRLLRNSEKSMM